jgi:serine/threonine protein kinase
MQDLVGKTLGRYRIVAKLGQGGMAEVYKAYQPGLDRYVAIKVMHSHMIDDQDFLTRFEREAHAIGRLRHPNIVQALDFDREVNIYFMAMEYIGGPTLKEEFRARKAMGKPFALAEVARIYTALCSAIDYAHTRGMVHRDLKPANVMINQEGQIVLTDFGIARILDATQHTRTGAMAGTPSYMSPEQGQGKKVDSRSDIYSLGVMLYELVTGSIPYDADTPIAVVMKHINEPLPLPTRLNPNLPVAVEQVILKAMAKQPEDRYQTAYELAQALREAVGLAPGDTLERNPLKALAAGPEDATQMRHATGPITPEEKAATAAALGGTHLSQTRPGVEDKTMPPPDRSPVPTPAPAKISPLLIGGGVAVLLVVAAIIGAVLTSGEKKPDEDGATQTAAALTHTDTQAATATAVWLAADDDRDGLTNGEEEELGTLSHKRDTDEDDLDDKDELDQGTDPLKPDTDGDGLKDGVEVSRGLDPLNADTDGDGIPDAKDPQPGEAPTLTPTSPQPTPTEATKEAEPTPTPTSPPALPTATSKAVVAVPPTPAPPTWTPTPAESPTPVPTPTSEKPAMPGGKLAFPMDNGLGKYDLFIVSMPDGQSLGKIQGAHQPNFRPDGAKLLVNGDGGSFGENVFQANTSGGIERAVSSNPQDLFPFYNPGGNRIVFSNPELVLGGDGGRNSYIFVQCNAIPPSEESDPQCQNLATMGILLPDGGMGDIIGQRPVWATNDQIYYDGCNTWKGGGTCGLFVVASWANKINSGGETPRLILADTSAFATDAKAGLVAYHSYASGNADAYVMNLDGSGVVNLSNSPANDGLPTISPNGRWVAFASDRSGVWAIWAAPAGGGAAVHLFDFPKPNPWATGGRDWHQERLSWGP